MVALTVALSVALEEVTDGEALDSLLLNLQEGVARTGDGAIHLIPEDLLSGVAPVT